jgi:murein DD-endopeptidase MepM/ murein hydrolase activator NlpD
MTPGIAAPVFRPPTASVAVSATAVLACAGLLWAFGTGGASVSLASLRLPSANASLTQDAAAAEHEAFTAVYRNRNSVAVTIEPGETLAGALRRAGANSADAANAIRAAGQVFNVANVQPGMEVELALQQDGQGPRLAGIAFRSSPGEGVTVARSYDGAFSAHAVQMPLTYEIARVAAHVDGSFYETAAANGATEREIGLFAEVFGYDVDFQRDVQNGDPFEIVFERFYDDRGETVRTGDPLFLALQTRRGFRAYYRFTNPETGQPEWYDGAGRSARTRLMRTPINGARLSSGYGMRLHPILGYTRMHRGVDFAAPTGTPIMAAGDGNIEVVATRNGYGLYVQIQHGDGFETAYAHMSRFAPGMRPGVRVQQGQVIGYVGSTGASTGPHLHFEVLQNGSHIDPASLEAAVGHNLEGAALVAFVQERNRIDRLRDARSGDAEAAVMEAEMNPLAGSEGANP